MLSGKWMFLTACPGATRRMLSKIIAPAAGPFDAGQMCVRASIYQGAQSYLAHSLVGGIDRDRFVGRERVPVFAPLFPIPVPDSRWSKPERFACP